MTYDHVRFWHLLIRRDAPFCPLLDQSGQSQFLARRGLSANDPKRTSRGAYFNVCPNWTSLGRTMLLTSPRPY